MELAIGICWGIPFIKIGLKGFPARWYRPIAGGFLLSIARSIRGTNWILINQFRAEAKGKVVKTFNQPDKRLPKSLLSTTAMIPFYSLLSLYSFRPNLQYRWNSSHQYSNTFQKKKPTSSQFHRIKCSKNQYYFFIIKKNWILKLN